MHNNKYKSQSRKLEDLTNKIADLELRLSAFDREANRKFEKELQKLKTLKDAINSNQHSEEQTLARQEQYHNNLEEILKKRNNLIKREKK